MKAVLIIVLGPACILFAEPSGFALGNEDSLVRSANEPKEVASQGRVFANEDALLSSLAANEVHHKEFEYQVKSRFDQYRDEIRRVHELEALCSDSDPGITEPNSARLLADQGSRFQSPQEQLRALAIPGPAYRARKNLINLVGHGKMQEIDRFLNVLPETVRFIEMRQSRIRLSGGPSYDAGLPDLTDRAINGLR
jgi:hypothetical protein